ncbi:MAG: hypothetical protein ACI83I_001937, partial [Bacteroidia bacterium]
FKFIGCFYKGAHMHSTDVSIAALVPDEQLDFNFNTSAKTYNWPRACVY